MKPLGFALPFFVQTIPIDPNNETSVPYGA